MSEAFDAVETELKGLDKVAVFLHTDDETYSAGDDVINHRNAISKLLHQVEVTGIKEMLDTPGLKIYNGDRFLFLNTARIIPRYEVCAPIGNAKNIQLVCGTYDLGYAVKSLLGKI